MTSDRARGWAGVACCGDCEICPGCGYCIDSEPHYQACRPGRRVELTRVAWIKTGGGYYQRDYENPKTAARVERWLRAKSLPVLSYRVVEFRTRESA